MKIRGREIKVGDSVYVFRAGTRRWDAAKVTIVGEGGLGLHFSNGTETLYGLAAVERLFDEGGELVWGKEEAKQMALTRIGPKRVATLLNKGQLSPAQVAAILAVAYDAKEYIDGDARNLLRGLLDGGIHGSASGLHKRLRAVPVPPDSEGWSGQCLGDLCAAEPERRRQPQ